MAVPAPSPSNLPPLASPPLSPGGSAANIAPAPATPVVPHKMSIWDELRHSHSTWGYIYRLGAPPVSSRVSSCAAAGYVNNVVVTSRYTWYNFVPLFLFQQFSRFANFYFLIVCILQAIPEVSITNGLPSSALPLAFVLFFDGIVTAREDYVRHRDDARANARKVLCMRNKRFVDVEWRDVKVGDILKVCKGEEFPADLVFLASEHEDDEQRGVCHVQTAQLDGETNLKIRNAHEKTVPLFQSEEDCANFIGRLVCEEPHENFAKFNGTLFLEKGATKGLVLDANATLLRGCVLKNVDAAFGFVIYTGRETKVRVKQSAVMSKKASIEAEINQYIVALICLQLVLCLVGAVGYFIWTSNYGPDSFYLHTGAPTAGDSVTRFFTFFLLISNIIPISLYVTMKLARTAQKFFMDNDDRCVYRDEDLLEKTNGEEGIFPLIVRAMDLNDELGQISHIFSDKTGTLTSNYMEFRKLTVNGVNYGRGTTDIGMARRRRLGQDVTELQKLMDANVGQKREVAHVNYIEGSESHPTRTLRGPLGDLNGKGAQVDPVQAEALRMFFLNMCLDHTVVLERVEDRATKQVKMQLSASSPDEEAFVLAGKYFGYNFKGRQKDTVILDIFGRESLFRVLVVIAYSSARQMMSVLVEDVQSSDPQKKYFLLCKGSDTRMFKLNVTETGRDCTPKDVLEQQAALISTTKAHLLEMAEDGLRTLAFSYRYIPEDELLPWLERYEFYLGDINEKRARDNKLPNKIDETAAEVERHLLFQGATANEDKLQDQVPETIALLAEAGVKIYMLTGDKQETAINIGYAARMLTNEFVRILITSEELFGDKLQEELAKRNNERMSSAAAQHGVSIDDYAALEKATIPRVQPTILDVNTRVKLRNYANVSRAKSKKLQEFSRPRGLIIDEPVMNLVWPSIPNLPKPTITNFRDVYKDMASLVARAAALTNCLQHLQYVDYTDSQWAEAEAEVLASMAVQELIVDEELLIKINTALTDAGLTALFEANGLAALEQTASDVLQILQSIKGASEGKELVDVDSLKADAAQKIEALKPALENAYNVARKVMILHGKDMQKDLLVIAESCKSVICCRCRPDQKKKMLELIRYQVKTSRCLAIGDGANDVDMIQAANVGVGIVGPEGVQAANASDYAIGRFKFLGRLLLMHGRWNYTRMSLLVCYMFYKNVFYAFCQMLYTVIAAWSGQKFYVEIASQTFNLVFTGVPILIAAVFDKDVSGDNAVKFPYLYSDGLFRRRLNISLLFWWLITAIYEATLLFVFTHFASFYGSDAGTTPYVFEFGTWVFTALVIIVNVRLALNVSQHSWLFVLSVAISVIVWFPAAFIMDAVDADGMRGGMQLIFRSGGFWLWLVLILAATQVHVVVITMAKRFFAPEYRDLVQEYEILLNSAGSKGSSYQNCCTCGMRRWQTPQRHSPAELITYLDQVLQPRTKRKRSTKRDQDAAQSYVAGGHNSQHFNASEVAELVQTLEVPFGPNLATLMSPMHPSRSCRHNPTANDLVVAEDAAEELIEWPIEQRMRISLLMKRNQLYDEAGRAAVKSMEHPEVALRRIKIDMLRARLSSLIEHGLTSDADDDTAAIPIPSPQDEPTSARPEAVNVGGTTERRESPDAQARLPASGQAGSPEGRKPRESSRYGAHDKRRTVTDFSVDDRSSAFYGDAISAVGRRAKSSAKIPRVVPESARTARRQASSPVNSMIYNAAGAGADRDAKANMKRIGASTRRLGADSGSSRRLGAAVSDV